MTLPLFDLFSSLPYCAGSPTSRDAARKVKGEETARHLRLIRSWLLSCGRDGATQKEMSERLGIQRATMAARCNYLAGGKIMSNGERELEVEIYATVRRRQGCAVYLHERFYGKAVA